MEQVPWLAARAARAALGLALVACGADQPLSHVGAGASGGQGGAAGAGGAVGGGGFRQGGGGALGGAGGEAPLPAECQGHVYQCGDLQDNDADGLVDAADPE